MTWRDDLRAIVRSAPLDALPELIAELARANAIATQRINRPLPNKENASPLIDRHLTADEVADRLSVSSKWVYEHATDLGGVKLSNGCVRFPAQALYRFLRSRRALARR